MMDDAAASKDHRGESRASKKRAKKRSKNNKGSPGLAAPPRDPSSSSGDAKPESSGRGSRDAAKRKPLPGSNHIKKKDAPRPTSTSSIMISGSNSRRGKRPRGEAERRSGGGGDIEEPTSSDADPEGDDESADADECAVVGDSELFGVDAGKKVQFQFQPREVGQGDDDNDDDAGDGNPTDPPAASAAAGLPKRRAAGKRSATVPPPSVTNITQLLISVASGEDGAVDTGPGENTEADADNAAAPSTSSSLPTTHTPWVSHLTTEQRANTILNFILQPSSVTTDEFYSTYWEKKPLLVQAAATANALAAAEHIGRFKGLMGLATIRDVTKSQHQQQQPIYYGRDLNVTKYEKVDGTYGRRTLDPARPAASRPPAPSPEEFAAAAAQHPDRFYVRVDHSQLWDEFYGKLGGTVRLLCPHKHFPQVHAALSLLEHEFGNMVGANAYLTPPNGAQGFAPHYDDIEAFCCQLEGQKRWKVYAPLTKAERLPRTSSRDYAPSDLRDAQPVMDVVLSPGDVLYMPRGWIHQACTLPEASVSPDGHGHSLHLTISTMQQWAWVDLMENLMSDALEVLSKSDRTTLLRDGLPRNFVTYMGVMHDSSDESMPESLKKRPYEAQEEDADELERLSRLHASREEFRHEAKRRIARVAQEAMSLLDASCDQMAKRFLSDRLPPAGLVRDADLNLQPDTLCRLARPGIARLVLEDGKAVLYHCADNSLVFHEHPLSPLEFEMDDAPSIEQLLTTVEPRWIAVQDLYHDSVDDKLAVAQALYDEGILAVR